MRAMRWGMVVVVLAVTAVVLLRPGEEPAPNVKPESPVVAALPVVEPSAPVQQEPAAPVALAPTSEAAHDVQFTLLRDGGAVVGERITLSRGRETIGGTTNVMGFVTLPLTPGEWSVDRQARTRTSPDKVLITPDSDLVTLTVVPRENLIACVVNEENAPVDAVVHVRTTSWTLPMGTRADGCVELPVDGAEADVWAASYDSRSATQHVQLPAKVLLHAEKLHRLWVELKPESVTAGVASISHRLGVSTGRCTPECSVAIVSGDYELLVAGVSNGELLFARHSGTAPSKDVELVMNLTAAPPISGVVRSAAGVPLPNVPLRFMALDVGLDDGAPRTKRARANPVIELDRVLTRDDGSFAVTPKLGGAAPFPTWTISAEPPWKLTPATVSLGDAPVQLTAELTAP